MRILILVLLVVLSAGPSGAVDPREILKDPILETRAREISKGVRCVVCQNQSIDDSDATLARDLRVLIRERLTAGDSNQQVVDYLVSRYGDFVLLKPPFKLTTLALWGGPLLIGFLGLAALISFYRRQRMRQSAAAPPPLNDKERRQLNDLLDGDPS